MTKEEKRVYDHNRYLLKKDQIAKQVAAYREANPDWATSYKKDWTLKKKYGISLEEYSRILADQQGGCKICGRLPGRRSLHVDHDHKTGEVVAILCSRCNTAIGLLQEDPTVLKTATLYVEAKHARSVRQ